MTPKEKAKELVDKYRELVISAPYVDSEDGSCIAETWMLTRSAKQCALIAVDEMINELDHLPFDDQDFGTFKMNYWQEVKQEIQNL